MLKFSLMAVGMIIVVLIGTDLKRRFSSETLVNGFMDKEKWDEIAPYKLSLIPRTTPDLAIPCI